MKRRRRKPGPYTTPGYRRNTNTAVALGFPMSMMGLMLLFSAYAGAGTGFWVAGGIVTAVGIGLSSSGRVY